MIAKPMGLASLNQFPQRAERLIPFGAARGASPAAMAHAAMAAIPRAVATPSMGGLHSLAPRMGPQPFRGPVAGGMQQMKFGGKGGY